VTAVVIEGRDAADSPQFKPLVQATAENFTVKELPNSWASLPNRCAALGLRPAFAARRGRRNFPLQKQLRPSRKKCLSSASKLHKNKRRC
jgi:hypothetical protein